MIDSDLKKELSMAYFAGWEAGINGLQNNNPYNPFGYIAIEKDNWKFWNLGFGAATKYNLLLVQSGYTP